MNKELLFNLYRIHSESGCEKRMRRFLRKEAYACGATSVETDSNGNLLIVKGNSETYPCLAAHMDQVQRNHSKDFTVVEIGDDVLAWSPTSHSQQGLGADDKNGLFICLELLRRFDVMKVAFFVQEESGGIGSQGVDLEFFKDCRFVIEPDRKGHDDLITTMGCGNVCSEEFIDAIGFASYGYRKAVGTFTDVANLVRRGVGISCLNLSCGYYNAHTDAEITVLPHLDNCMKFVAHIVETCTEVYPYAYSLGRYDYDLYDLYYYGGTFGNSFGSKYKSWQKSDSKSKSKTWDSGDFEDDDNSYYDEGYYDSDVQTMQEYLELMPELSFDMIKSNYMADFFATQFFDKQSAETELRSIYEVLKEDVYDHAEFWDDDDEVVTKKVS